MYCKYHKVLFIFFVLLATISCSKTGESNNEATNNATITNLLIEGASNSLIIYKNDTIRLNEELENSINTKDTVRQIAINKRLGEIHSVNVSHKGAILHYRKYLLLAQDMQNTTHELLALNSLAKSYDNINMKDESFRFYFNALSKSEALNNPNKQISIEKAKTYIGIGSIYATYGQYNNAEDFFDNAQKIVSKYNDKELQADIFMWKGYIEQEKRLYDSANDLYNNALDIYISLNSTAGLGFTFLRLGELNLALNNYEGAIINLNNALSTLVGTTEVVNLMKTNITLGNAYAKIHNYEQAEKYTLNGEKIASSLNLSNYLQDISYALSNIYKAQNKKDLSEHYHAMGHKYVDQINSRNIEVYLFNTYMEYERSKNKQEIDNLIIEHKMRSKMKNIVIIATTTIIVLFLLAIIIYFHYLRMKKEKTNAIIASAHHRMDLYDLISEELKSPITIISGLVSKLKTNLTDGATTKNVIDLDIIDTQTQRISFLVNETLMISSNNDKILGKWVFGNINDYLQFILFSFKDEAEIKGIKLLFMSNYEEINMPFCTERLRLVFNNIVLLLLEESVKNDKIILSINQSKNEKTCHINLALIKSDKASTDIPEIFKDVISENDMQKRAYFSSVNSKFIDQLIKDMHGSLSIHYNNENNISFNVDLNISASESYEKYNPLIHDDNISVESSEVLKKELKHYSPEIKDTSKKTVLIVEDNHFLSFYIFTMLHEKYNVVIVMNGKEALAEIDKNIPDIVITKLFLSDFDGNQLTEALKKASTTSNIPVVMITSRGSKDSRISSIKSGVDAFLTKPFAEDELKAIVNQLIESRTKIEKANKKKVVESVDPIEVNKEFDKEDYTFIQKISDIIYHEINNNDLSPQMIADKMFMSTSNLNRKIKSITDLSTTGYILNLRLNRAKKLLTGTQKQIGEIAMECGFSDFAYFSRTFKKEFGITPSQYQRIGVE